jgi:enterobactin synthetase component D / holo-[acyl-carrier protein] synthase
VIEEILPAQAVAVDTRADRLDIELFAAERAALGNAVEKRRREFVTARACAREALGRLGLPPAPIVSGERGEPLWPPGVVGSITHCAGYRGCALTRAGEFLGLGIDAEPNGPLPAGVLAHVAVAQERTMLERLAAEEPAVHWDRLLFCAKETIYKVWFPLARSWLGFEDALLTLDPGGDGCAGTFEGRLLVPGPPLEGGSLATLSGRWLARDGLLLTAIALAREANMDDRTRTL